MFTFDIEKLPDEIRTQLIADDVFDKQVEQLGTPGGVPSTRKKLDEVDFGIIHPPVSGRQGGRSRTRLWLPWVPSARDPSIRLQTKDVPRAHVSNIVHLSEILWGTHGDHRALLAHVSEFSGKEAYEVYIIYWLGIFVANLRMIYPDSMDEKILDYFQSGHFKMLVLGLTHGYYDG